MDSRDGENVNEDNGISGEVELVKRTYLITTISSSGLGSGLMEE